MRSKNQTEARVLGIATAIFALAIVAGCAQTRSWMDRMRGSDEPAEEPVIPGAPAAEEYLDDLYRLAAGDPATQAEIYAESESEATLTPAPQTSLRYALVLATPGHAEADPERAQRLLREILAQRELLTSAEIALATLHLGAVEQQIVLQNEARRLRASSSRTARTEEAAMNQRLATVEAENRQLRRDLEEAERKLEAITTIERSIREQGE
jgi:hypothetical protein